MTTSEGFAYTCEQCLGLQYLTDEQAEWYRDKDGWLRIVCDECLKAAREEARAELEEAKP